MENFPTQSFTVQLVEPVPEEGRSGLQHTVDSVFSEFGYIRIKSTNLGNNLIITYHGAGNSYDRAKLESAILSRLSESGVGQKVTIVP